MGVVEADSIQGELFDVNQGQSVPGRSAQLPTDVAPLGKFSEPALTINARTILSQTTATQYVPRPNPTLEGSIVAPTSVISRKSNESDIIIPPISHGDGKDFECPYCFFILEKKLRRRSYGSKPAQIKPYIRNAC
jgi:hypothetical protein